MYINIYYIHKNHHLESINNKKTSSQTHIVIHFLHEKPLNPAAMTWNRRPPPRRCWPQPWPALGCRPRRFIRSRKGILFRFISEGISFLMVISYGHISDIMSDDLDVCAYEF